jgi:hypothetical protein
MPCSLTGSSVWKGYCSLHCKDLAIFVCVSVCNEWRTIEHVIKFLRALILPELYNWWCPDALIFTVITISQDLVIWLSQNWCLHFFSRTFYYPIFALSLIPLSFCSVFSSSYIVSHLLLLNCFHFRATISR